MSLNRVEDDFGGYAIRFVLYIVDTLFTTAVMAVGLACVSVLSIFGFLYLDVPEFSVLIFVPIVGMAVYLAQWKIGEKADDDSEGIEYDSISEQLLMKSFILLYYNLLFVLSVIIGVLLALFIEPQLPDIFLVVAFLYPMLDMELVRKLNISPAALPVAMFLAMLHQIGRVTWIGLRNIEIDRPPLIDEWLNSNRRIGQ